MPKIVDHDVRRSEVIEVACGLIAEKGVDGLTMRELARAAGVSTGVVSHYFENKSELLTMTYEAVNGRIRARIRERLDADAADITGCLTAMLPLDQDRLRDWRVLFSYWGVSVGDADLAAEQQRRARITRELVVQTIHAAQSRRLIGSGFGVEEAAHRLVALMQGIATQTVFDPESWPADMQRQLIADAVAAIELSTEPRKIA